MFWGSGRDKKVKISNNKPPLVSQRFTFLNAAEANKYWASLPTQKVAYLSPSRAAGVAVPVLSCRCGVIRCRAFFPSHAAPLCCERRGSCLRESWRQMPSLRAGSHMWAPSQAGAWQEQACHHTALLLACHASGLVFGGSVSSLFHPLHSKGVFLGLL